MNEYIEMMEHTLSEWVKEYPIEWIEQAYKDTVGEPTTQERQAESDKFDAAFQDGYDHGYAQARFDYEQEPTTKNDLGVDCISRDDVRDVMQELWGTSGELMDRLMALPSVTPQPRKGHWIKGYTFPDGTYWKCDKCNELIKVKFPMNYCNNCGADMRAVEE